MKLTAFGLAVLAASEGGFTPEVMRTNNIEPATRREPQKRAPGAYAAKCEQSARRRAAKAREMLGRIPTEGRGDTAEINIPWTPVKSKRLDATIDREIVRNELERQISHYQSRAQYWASKKEAA